VERKESGRRWPLDELEHLKHNPPFRHWDNIAEWLVDRAQLLARPPNPLEGLPEDVVLAATTDEETFNRFLDDLLGLEEANQWRAQFDAYVLAVKELVAYWRQRGLI
jgi:hypothetical protein